jgi:hypothetical protein
MENELMPDDLQTWRLILRPIVESDAEGAHLWFTDSGLMKASIQAAGREYDALDNEMTP